MEMQQGLKNLAAIIKKQHRISIDSGLLNITPAGGLPVPSEWLAKHERGLLLAVVRLTGATAYQYASHSTGKYKGRYQGLTMQFNNLLTNTPAYAIFNVELTRARTTSQGVKGESLPGGQFRIRKGHEFYNFWGRTGLKRPRWLGEYHGYMGNLKHMVYTMEIDHKGKADNKTICALSCTYEQISAAFYNDAGGEVMGKPWGSHREAIGSSHGEANATSQAIPTDRAIFSHGDNMPRLKLISRQGNKGAVDLDNTTLRGCNIIEPPNSKRPEEQTTGEWLADYDNTHTWAMH